MHNISHDTVQPLFSRVSSLVFISLLVVLLFMTWVFFWSRAYIPDSSHRAQSSPVNSHPVSEVISPSDQLDVLGTEAEHFFVPQVEEDAAVLDKGNAQ